MSRNRWLTIGITIAALGVGGGIGIASAEGISAPRSGSGPDFAAAVKLPDEIGIVDSAGNVAGFAERSALERRPDFAAFPDDPQAASEEWLRTPIAVTGTADPQGVVVGYYFHNVGFVSAQDFASGSFDIEQRLAESRAKQEQELRDFNAARSSSSMPR